MLLALLSASAYADPATLFMWKASAKHGEVLYILGSLHYATSSCYPLADQIERAYSTAAVVGIEVDLSRPESAEIAGWLGRYDGHARLKRDVPAPLLKEVVALAKKRGWDIESIARTRPWVVAAMLSAADFETHGYDRQMGIDLHFIQAAKRDDKRLVELEPMREQFDVFNRLPRSDQVFLLKESVEAIKSGDNVTSLGRMIDAWSRGDSVAFEQLTRASLVNAPDPEALSIALYKTRNQRMAKRIETLVQEGEQVFVVVGAAHLAGPYSLLDALRGRGFEVEQVNAYSALGTYP